jgi:hypothetical protein
VLELRSKKTGMQQKCMPKESGHAPTLLIRNYSWDRDLGFKQGPMPLGSRTLSSPPAPLTSSDTGLYDENSPLKGQQSSDISPSGMEQVACRRQQSLILHNNLFDIFIRVFEPRLSLVGDHCPLEVFINLTSFSGWVAVDTHTKNLPQYVFHLTVYHRILYVKSPTPNPFISRVAIKLDNELDSFFGSTDSRNPDSH